MSIEPNYQQFLDNLSVAVFIVDEQRRFVHINPAGEVLMAVSRSKVLGKPIQRYCREEDDSHNALLQASKDGNQYTKRQASWYIHNGEQLTVDYTVTPLNDDEGMIIEVTPLDRLLRINREESLISSQETTRSLVRSMAHEIKNPLGGIRGAAQLLARELPTEDLQEFTDIIIEEVDRLRNLVDRMLGPRSLPNMTEVNAHELLQHVAKLISPELGGHMQLVKDYDPSIPEFPADREQLIQSLLNIIRNAMQALSESEAGGGTITLRTRIQRQFTIGRVHHKLVCRIDIIDDGPGIPQDIAEDIFYPMITGRAEGTGLGLSISQNLIQQHHGLIECDSHPGRTQFSIYLPLEQPHAT